MKKTKTKCYLYTRVSTSMQVDGYSLDAQRDKLRKYAEYEDMVVAGEYSDEGFSGKNIQGRHEFQRMLQDIQDCKDGVEYVLVFKLSRFGRNAADVLNSLQLMQDFGVNLICVEDGIDSSKDSGKLMISVLSAVAEIERENIRTQTMAGREQKAREGKWNGGFAPYGYRLEKGELLIAEDEVDVIRTIFDRYIHTNDGVSGVAKYLNRQGCDLIHDLSRCQIWLRISHTVHQINNNICIQSHFARYCDSLADSLYAALCIGKCTLFLCIAYTRKDNICILSCLCHEKFLKHKEIKTL